ncbi:MAG: hypothetical protein WD768_13315 [Phycisphaeraceae bacterium]
MASVFKEASKLSKEDQELIRLYSATGRPADDLPYTTDFEQMCLSVYGSASDEIQGRAFRRLLALRKSRRLPRIGRMFVDRTPINEDEAEILTNLIARSAGTIGHRDSLPFTAEFRQLVKAFNEQTGRKLDPHTVWRMVSRVAKWPVLRQN